MFSRRCVYLVTLFAGAGMLAACEDSGKAPEVNTTASAPKVPKPKSDDLPADMVAAVAANPTNSPVSVHFSLGARPEVNKALPVEIAIVPGQDFETVSAHFLSQNGLAVTVGGVYGPVTTPAVGKPLRHQLVLLPGREGVFVLSVSIDTLDRLGANYTRVFSIPLLVSVPGVEEAADQATRVQPQSPNASETN